MARSLAAARLVLALALGLAAAGCAKDPAREEALRAQRDQTTLRGVLDAEARVQQAYSDEGRAEKAHRDDEAAGLLESSVLPAVDGALAMARAASPESTWGRARRDELIAALAARKEELPRYAAALRSHDQEAQLESALKQAEIEKRVMKAAQTVAEGPSADAAR